MSGSSKKTGARPAPVSVRLSDSERAALAVRAGSQPVSTYIKRVLFGDNPASARRNARHVTTDQQLLARVLAQLGKSGLGESLVSMAIMAASGVLYVDQDTLAYLRRACEDVREMRRLLMEALGKKPPEEPSLEGVFNQAAQIAPPSHLAPEAANYNFGDED